MTGTIRKRVKQQADSLIQHLHKADFIVPLAFRLYLAPVMWVAGSQKLINFDNTVEWFGNSEWGLGLPAPLLLAILAATTEVIGSICLLLGLATRLLSIPLMITMLVAAATVHWDNGWLAIAGQGDLFETERTRHAIEKLNIVRSILKEHSDYAWLTEHGPLVVLNNGIEFAVTYFIMLLSLLFSGSGRYISVDHWIYHFTTNKRSLT